MATFHEMDTVYSLEDAWDMLEMIAIDRHNQRTWEKYFERR